MKVGIMSMQRIENYGSFLQAYSLRQMLEELGYEVCFVDYEIEPCIVRPLPDTTPRRSIPYRAIRKLYYFAKNTVEILTGKRARNEKLESMSLRVNYSCYLRELGVTDERTENTPVDVLIIGSDEVFNCLQTNPAVGYSKQLFGENVSAKSVITYAASAGFTTISGLKEAKIQDEIAEMLRNNFDCISVRDKNTYDLIYQLTGEIPQEHLDPVLVADLSEKIVQKEDLQHYVVVYSYENRMQDLLDEAEAIQTFAHNHGLKTVSIGNFQSWTDLKISASPFELLGYIKNADYVVTDTFHGTIFSIILKKQFATLIRQSNQQKLRDLLIRFGLQNREVKELKNIATVLTTPICFEQSDAVRIAEREKSLTYLSNAISGNIEMGSTDRCYEEKFCGED